MTTPDFAAAEDGRARAPLRSEAQTSSRFRRRWLTGWCCAVGAFGVVLAGAALEATSAPARVVFDILGGPAALELDAPLRFSLALLGAVTIGWSLTLLALFEAADRLGAAGRPVWRLATGAILVWYVVDSALSVATGFPLNAASNTVFLAAFLLPVISTGVLKRGSA